MKAKLKATPLNSILGVNIGLPSLSETGVAIMNAEMVITAYEKQAVEILKRDGYPITFEKLCKKQKELLPDLANGKGTAPVYSIFWMLFNFNKVRADIEKNNADMAVCDMAIALHHAIRAQLKPIALYFDMGKANIDGGKDGGVKSGAVRRKKLDIKKELWQVMAKKTWRKHPTWKNKRVAEDIVKIIGGNVRTIRTSIKKPIS